MDQITETGVTTKLVQHPLMIAAMLIAAATGVLGYNAIPTNEPALTYSLQTSLDAADIRIVALERDVDALEKRLSQPRTEPNNDQALTTDVKFLRQRIEALDRRQRDIERAIMVSPARALELPMLRKDIQELRSSREREQAVTKDNIDRIYNVFSVSIGGLLVSVVLMALDRFFGGRRKHQAERGD